MDSVSGCSFKAHRQPQTLTWLCSRVVTSGWIFITLPGLRGKSRVRSKGSPTCLYEWCPVLHKVAQSPRFQVPVMLRSGIPPLEILAIPDTIAIWDTCRNNFSNISCFQLLKRFTVSLGFKMRVKIIAAVAILGVFLKQIHQRGNDIEQPA